MKNKVSELRKKSGLSQDMFAEKLGVSRQTVSSIEKGKYNPSLPLAMHIAELLNKKVEDVFFLEDKDYKK
ncbi:helix-turn-helix transcriptional regulator [Bacillus shivajii]|uniref:helix-turn-helix transcriptional regulator n=1 Tax=Bacillus shivajii TaxID=1983719 RepID=UPI001CFB1057|nr:helix-turn-helix transcriptional regulator [Bacillus shivajii]UCZ53471.1 helix-turn-helix transcriptional regulator [Bacillus shivajii]